MAQAADGRGSKDRFERAALNRSLRRRGSDHHLLQVNCLYALLPTILHLGRSALHQCLQWHGISRLPDVEGDKPKRQKFKRYPTGCRNQTIKDATVKRYHYDSHERLCSHLAVFLAAYNFARSLKTLSGLTPNEYICNIRASEPDRSS